MMDFARLGLAAFQDAALEMLAQAALDRQHALHVLTLATLAPDGAPRLRSVVLRDAVLPERRLAFHADRRSAKIGDIEHDPRGAVLGYDPAARLQIRLEGRCVLNHADAAAREAWERTGSGSRQIYRITPASGAVVAREAEIDPRGSIEAEAFRNFALIGFTFRTAEILFLGQERHRRVRCLWDEERRRASWIVP